jgi:hypothetical protein
MFVALGGLGLSNLAPQTQRVIDCIHPQHRALDVALSLKRAIFVAFSTVN